MTISTSDRPVLNFTEFEQPWTLMRLSEVLNLTTRPLKMKDDKSYSLVTVKRRYGGIVHRGDYLGKEVKVKSQFLLEAGDFLISKRQISHNACGLVPEELAGSIVSNEYTVFNPKGNLDMVFFNYFCHLPRVSRTFYLSSTGVHIEKMIFKVDDWLNRKFYFPSLPEQQKIAAFLSAVDQKIQQLTRKKGLLETYKKGLMQQLFSGALRFKDEEGKEYPDWEEKKLGEVGDYFNGLTGKSGSDFGIGKPYINYKQIFASSRIDIRKFDFVKIEEGEKQSKALYGDAFFTTSSETPSEVGFASVLLDQVKDLYLNSFCFGYRSKSFEVLNPHFSRFLFRSEKFRKEVVKLAQGSTRYNISKVQMMKILISLPIEAEQLKIANCLAGIDTKIESISTQITKTQTFKKGLLQQMFV